MDNINSSGQLLLVTVGLISLALLVFEILMLIDAIQNKKLDNATKALWVLVILLFSPVGMVVYYFVAYSKRT